ncbi:MAG: hypothetical protein KGJ59_12310 [Bacteroidota bacterium]|nr:hypothetical protein [Bacteroidota bacterium]
MIRIIVVSFLFIGVAFAGSKEERVVKEIAEHQVLICNAAYAFNLSPRLIASVIYAERFLNYNWEDALLDGLFAESGYNSSVGFAQIKVTTAFWIEKEVHNTLSLYYLGNEAATRIPRSTSRPELIHRLFNDSMNIFYSCAYIAMIEQRWEKAGAFLSDQNKTGIIATLYSLGIIRFDGTERVPHPNPQMNHFGETAQKFYDGFVLRQEFQE